ncbi:hypothetical protein V1477_015169 [Vespula maculifrons]|uniref:Uncharacterized protein n=2 Tax=Vespula TaxID=7451 RepID=A0A834JIF7_VESVU|nr:hypothetical protein HZH66_010006 [Vespula vulgaris]
MFERKGDEHLGDFVSSKSLVLGNPWLVRCSLSLLLANFVRVSSSTKVKRHESLVTLLNRSDRCQKGQQPSPSDRWLVTRDDEQPESTCHPFVALKEKYLFERLLQRHNQP